MDPRRRFRDDDDDTNRGHKRDGSCGIIHCMTSWMDNHSMDKNHSAESGQFSGWFRDESSRGRAGGIEIPPLHHPIVAYQRRKEEL
jgi:hypothetical protein